MDGSARIATQLMAKPGPSEAPAGGAPVQISHKWVHQVLRQRGIPSPGLDALHHALGTCAQEDLGALRRAFGKVEAGVEDPATQLLVQNWLQSVPAHGVQESLPPPQEPACVPASGAEEADANEQAPAPGSDRVRAKHHIYGAKGALTIELDTLRAWDGTATPKYTVRVEAAKALGPRRYDWEHKIPFQIMLRELPLLACALLGTLQDPLTFANHGPAADKTLEVADQEGHVFVKLRQTSSAVAVRVTPSDVFAWLDLVMLALSLNSPHLAGDAILRMLDRVAAMANTKERGKTA